MRTIVTACSVALFACGSSGGGDGDASTSTNSDSSATAPTDDATDAPDDDGDDSIDDGSSTSPGTSTSAGETTTSNDTTAGDSTGVESSTGGERACTGEFPAMWNDGTDCGEPEIQVHLYDEDTYILRQSLCTSFEGPFMYLLFGQDRVLLEDTGDGGIPIAQTVYAIIDEWLAANGRESIDLVVVNSHAHGDHVAGNSMFEGMPDTTVVTPSVAGLSDYFGIDDWPTQSVEFDLGGRVIDVIPIPGHQTSHIAFFDRNEGLLLTGDTLYPGRLYIADFDAYVASVQRLVDTVPEADVCHVLGTHVEMTQSPGDDFPFGADEHPDEHVLQLEWAHLVELRDAVAAMDVPQLEVHDDFIVYPL